MCKCLLLSVNISNSKRILERKKLLVVGVIIEDCGKETAFELTLKKKLEFQ
jgi:hypothetical protein